MSGGLDAGPGLAVGKVRPGEIRSKFEGSVRGMDDIGFKQFVLDQLSGLPVVSCRVMFGG